MQTTFIIGNLVVVDKKVAETFFNLYNLHNVLIQILEEYVKEHIQVSNFYPADVCYSYFY